MSKIEQIRTNIRNQLQSKKDNQIESIKRRNNKYNKYYQSHDWKQLREWKINNYPVCQNCLHYGIVTPATEIHHRIPFSTGTTEEAKWQLLLDPTNIVSLCSSCHDLFHNTMRAKHRTDIDQWIEPQWMIEN